MTTSPRSLRIDEDRFWLELDDGRALAVPLAWFPRLLHATPAQLKDFTLSRRGVHWESLDEDVSIEGLLKGLGAFGNADQAA